MAYSLNHDPEPEILTEDKNRYYRKTNKAIDVWFAALEVS